MSLYYTTTTFNNVIISSTGPYRDDNAITKLYVDYKLSELIENVEKMKNELSTYISTVSDELTTSISSETERAKAVEDELSVSINNKLSLNGGTMTGDLIIGENTSLYIGKFWRIKASNDSRQLVFEYCHNPEPANTARWVVATPSIQNI